MKKKKQNSSNLLSDLDLKSLICEQSLFFDKLVELIPSRFYLPVDDTEKPWFQGLSKVAKASSKKQSRENIKKARINRFDPEKSSETTLDKLKKSIDEEKTKEERDEKTKGEDKSATYEALRERYHKRIAELRAQRNADGDSEEKMRKNEKKREIWEGKRKRNAEEEEDEKAALVEGKKIEEEAAKASEGLSFGHVKLGNEEERKKKRKKLSKAQALEEAKKLEEMKKDPEEGKKFSWKAAVDRAAGNKVHDDPKLINKSIKKDKKQREKNVGKWKERIDSRDKVRMEKQQKRSGNISERIQDKKARRIAKREKKLMRPGFEGRKEGYINKS